MPGGGNRYPDIARQLRQHAHNAKLGHPQSERTQRQRKNNFFSYHLPKMKTHVARCGYELSQPINV
ncbi:hypothetical protein LFZ31_24850 [Salmonella enterica subsp. enterica serovar Newport str. S09097]|nr:hypothetical protein LFZ31_24850 [Salmonella enterica subsp. enterica serovar Newport str. S09097]